MKMDEKKKHALIIKILSGFIAVLAIAIVILIITRPKPDVVPDYLQGAVDELMTTPLTTVTLSKMTEQVGELTTKKYYYRDIHEDKKEKENFFDSEELTLIVYAGMIHAGIDLQKVTYEIDPEAKTITATLPQPEILAHEFDNSKVRSYDVKKSIFNKGKSYQDSAQKFEELKQIKEEALLKDEAFWQSVKADTETALTNFFQASDLTKYYTIQFSYTCH